MANGGRNLPHLLLHDTALTEGYTTPRPGRHKPAFARNRREHSAHLQQALDRAREAEEARLQAAAAAGQVVREGSYLVAELEPGYEQALKSLESSGIELVAVRSTSTALHATIYVPRGKLALLERKVVAYATQLTKSKRPKNEALVTAIRNFRRAAVKSFWTDDVNVYPANEEVIWWEVWLRGEGPDVAAVFRDRAAATGMVVGSDHLAFPDRTVVVAQGSIEQLAASIEILDSIAELRRAKDSPALYVDLRGHEARAAIEGLLGRANRPRDGAPAIVILDTGVTAAHPLIAPFVDQQAFRAARTEWGGHDWQGHGTEMAGLALFGDLGQALGGDTPLDIATTLESVKILPNDGQNQRELHGAITQDAINVSEIDGGERQRIYSMAVTAPDFRDRGRPSSWSAEIDQLAVGIDDDRPRLIIVSAGNSATDARRTHPAHLETETIHDPAQAWNALTVGASTTKWSIDDPTFDGWKALASPGDLSPATSTSRTWDRIWPLKPDIVLEGGNSAVDPGGTLIDSPDSLGLLSTYYQPLVRPFTISRETSAACALGARMAGHVQSLYPAFWPETVRALLVHSAEWSELMRRQYLRGNQKRHFERLIQYCGFGMPSLERALWSARNDLTLIVQETLQPFVERDNQVKMRDMHLHTLPWPADALRALGEAQVELRVTLSYFIEPNPARRGWKYRHRYASHGLRFDVQTPTEDVDDFRARVNKQARAEEEEETSYAGDSTEWQLGWQRRHRGSIHSDMWTGTAAALADRQHVSVVPVGGWWKERPRVGRGNTPVRYALVVTIRVPAVDVDIYTPVATQIGVPIVV